MASENNASKAGKEAAPQDWQKKESFGRFVRDITIAAVVLGGGLFLYKTRVDTGKKVREFGKQAREEMLKDTPKAYADAEQNLVKMIELEKDQPYATATLAELYAIRWVDFGVDADAPKAKEWDGKAVAMDVHYNERYGADILVKLGDRQFAEAETMGAEVSKKAASSHIVNGYGRALRALGKLEEARQALKKSADTEWRNPRFACDFADLYFEDSDFVNAENFYGKGVEANADHARSLIGRSRAQIAHGQHVLDATQTLQDVLGRPADQLTPKLKSSALTGMAELRLFEQKWDEAGKLADEALAAYPSNSWAQYAKGRALAGAKAPGASEAFAKALEMDKYVPAFYYGASAALGDLDGAKAVAIMEDFAKVVKPDDRYFLAYGDLLKKLGKTDEALAQYAKAVEQNGFKLADAHYARGALYLESKKDLENAQKELEAALAANEVFPDAHAKLGQLQFEKKAFEDGCQQYAQALAKMKMLQQPREKINAVIDEVNDRLVKANKKDIAKAWMTESKALVR